MFTSFHIGIRSMPLNQRFKRFTKDFIIFSDLSLTTGSSLCLWPGIQNCTMLMKINVKFLLLTLPPCIIFFSSKVDLLSISRRHFSDSMFLLILHFTLVVTLLHFIILFFKCCLWQQFLQGVPSACSTKAQLISFSFLCVVLCPLQQGCLYFIL